MFNAEWGLVVARQGNKVTVLTPAGEWRTLRPVGQLPEVGEEVMLPPLKKRPPWQVMAAAAAIVLLLVLALPLARRAAAPPVPGLPAYYVNVDINPSVELAVDEREKVISARGLNSDGEKLLAAVALKDEKVVTAIQILTREAVRQGYYLPDRPGAMMVTVVPVPAEASDKPEMAAGEELGRKLTREASTILEQARVPAVVKAAAVQPEIRQHAAASGLSAGRYSILLEALDNGLPVTAAELQKGGLASVLEKFDGGWEKLLEKLQEDKDLLQKEKQLGAALQKALGQQAEPGGNGGKSGNGDRGDRGQDGSNRSEALTMEQDANNGQPGKKPEAPGRDKGSAGRSKGSPPGRANPADRSGLEMAREIRALLHNP